MDTGAPIGESTEPGNGRMAQLTGLAAVLFLAACISSLFGQGGGVLYAPVQLWLGVPPHLAAAQSLLLVLVTSVSSTLVYHSREETDWLLCVILEIPTGLGASMGGYLSSRLPQHVLGWMLCFLLVLAAIAVRVLYRRAAQNTVPIRPRRFGVLIRRFGGKEYALNLWLISPVMFAVGLLTSAVGLGGGILKLPAMVLLFGIPWRIAVGSSAFMVGVTAFAGLAGHIYVGHLIWTPRLLLYALAVFTGAQVGSRVSHIVNQTSLQTALSWFLLITAAVTFVRVTYFLPPPA